MKVAVLKANKSFINIEDRAEKPIKDYARLKVMYCGLCGADITFYKQIRKVTEDLVLGHEFCGWYNNKLYVVIPDTEKGYIGSNLDGGMQEYFWVDKKLLFEANDLADQPILATLIEPISCVVHLINKYMPVLSKAKKAAIIGNGFIGSVIKLGIERDIDVEVISKADKVEDNKYDLVFECSGTINGFNKALHSTKPSGTIIQIGHIRNNLLKGEDLDLDLILRKELTLSGVFRSDFNEAWHIAYRFIKEHREECLKLIDKVYDLKDTNKAFEEKIKNSYKKVVIKI